MSARKDRLFKEQAEELEKAFKYFGRTTKEINIGELDRAVLHLYTALQRTRDIQLEMDGRPPDEE